MNFVEAITSGFKNYVNFAGRSARSEFWWWQLFFVLVSIVAGIIDALLFSGSQLSPISSLAFLALVIPSIAVSVRRFHDLDKSGWWILLLYLTWGAIAFWKGTVGPNRFGPDPFAVQKL